MPWNKNGLCGAFSHAKKRRALGPWSLACPGLCTCGAAGPPGIPLASSAAPRASGSWLCGWKTQFPTFCVCCTQGSRKEDPRGNNFMRGRLQDPLFFLRKSSSRELMFNVFIAFCFVFLGFSRLFHVFNVFHIFSMFLLCFFGKELCEGAFSRARDRRTARGMRKKTSPTMLSNMKDIEKPMKTWSG